MSTELAKMLHLSRQDSRWARRLFETVVGMSSNRELEALYAAAVAAQGSGPMVEIGSWLGRSTIALAHACRRKQQRYVIAVDTFEGNQGKRSKYIGPLGPGETIEARFRRNIAEWGLDNEVRVCPKASRHARADIHHHEFALVFVDACHDYECVAEDLRLWAVDVSSEGILAIHDYVDAYPGTIRAVNEFVSSHNSFETIGQVDSLLLLVRR